MTPEGVRIELKGSRDHERTQVGRRGGASCARAPTRRCGSAGLLEQPAIRRVADRPEPSVPFPVTVDMTQRARKTASPLAGVRSGARSWSASASLVAAMALLAVGGVRHLGAQRRADTPPLDHLKPDQGGLELGRLRGRRQPPRLHPVGHDPPPGRRARGSPSSSSTPRSRSRTSTSTSTAASTTAPIVRAAWADLKAGAAGAGRLDDHPAAGPQPLHRQPAGGHRSARSRRRSWRPSTRTSTRSTRSSPST